MPRTPIDYKKAVIYSIVSKTDETLLYVGSTTDFRKRKGRHKSDCNNENRKSYNFEVYVMIRANGGWDAFEMKPVKEFPCENKTQLIIEEERIRTEMNANLNTNRAYSSPEEKKEQAKKYCQQHIEERKEQVKEYYHLHKDEILEYHKEYRQQHKEEIKEYKKDYRQQNKEKIAEQLKEYHHQHREERLEKMTEYRKQNRDKINQQRREKRKS